MLRGPVLTVEPARRLRARARGRRAERADNPVRWVHISEHEDPTPWLSGGELLLTTGINLGTAGQAARATSSCSPATGLAGLGFGTGFDHERLPKAIVEAAEEHELAAVRGPLLDAVHRDHRARRRPPGQRAVRGARARHRRCTSGSSGWCSRGAAWRRSSPRPARRSAARRSSSTAPGASSPRSAGAASSRPRRSTAIARRDRRPRPAARRRRSPPSSRRLAGRALAVPVPGRRGGAAGRLARGDLASATPLGDFERLCARQAAIVVGLELMRERVVRETERRLAGDLLADALGDRLEADELRGRLRPFGIGGEAAVLVFDLDDPPAAEATLESALADAGVPGARRDQRRGRPAAALRGRRRRRPRPGRDRAPTPARRSPADPAQRRPRRGQPPRRASARCAAPSTRRAARSRRPRSPTATPPRSPRTATSAPSPCCSRSRTTTRCASTATACSTRSSAPRASTAASCCARWRPSSRTTATGSGPRASSTATATRCATGSARSRS